ncbi:unnamed protein product [Adineta steineri]|uniref:Uncharacterized protein n=1 Tax=Adineta steineri TaxID=433720 RepID=A0A820DJP2_9BILA|nr:unnamed protein product [Adineta steineri]CAF3810321.1 unnamed protein product [Adineta steineri]CAF4232956.1 unnamed protein product [Adineta steineri]
MYAPVQTAAVRRSRGTALSAGGPILAICCLGFILFLIAATIVLALIPVYLSTRSGSSSSSSSPRYLALRYIGPSKRASDSGLLYEGKLDSQSLLNINSAVEKALKLQSGSVVAESGTATYTNSDTTQVIYCPFHFTTKCDKCGNMGYLQNIKPFTITVNNTIDGFNQGPFPYTVTLILTSINIPTSTVAPTTDGKSYTVSLTVPDSVPTGNVDTDSLPTLGSAVATHFGVASNALAVDSAQVTASKKRKRRGFGLIRERRATRHLYIIFHFLLSVCPSCADPTFITKIESLTISITVIISIGGVSVPQFSGSGSVALSSTVSTTASGAGSVTTSTIAGATAKVVG